MAVEPVASRGGLTFSAGGFYAFRCAVLTIGLTIVALAGAPELLDRPLLLASRAAAILALGLGLFFGDYRARRGRRTPLGAHAGRFARRYGLVVVAPTLIPAPDALRMGRTPSFLALLAVPTLFLIGLGFSGLLVPWPWSRPPAPESA